MMNTVKALLTAGLLITGLASALAQTPSSVRIRGTITGLSGTELRVNAREGNEVTINITAATRISVLYPRKLRDIRQNNFVGVTAIPEGSNAPLLARAKGQRGTGEGHYDWDLEPGSSMTNANVDTIENSGNSKELTLGYKGGSQKVIVPPDTPIISFRTADRSVLMAGEQVFCIAQKAASGSLTALHISVGENGMKPAL